MTYIDASVPGFTPGSDEWRAMMTASKVAAVMGHSTYDSWFSLYYRMNGTIPPEPENEDMVRGQYLEPAILSWFATHKFPGIEMWATGMWVDPDDPRMGCTPDGVVVPADGGPPELVEAKSDARHWEYGEPGTNQVPLGYYDQAMFQLLVFRTHYPNTHVVHVPVFVAGGMNFEYFRVEWDEEYAERLRKRTTLFMDNLDSGNEPSLDPMDGHVQTYQAIRELHPDIVPGMVELTDDTAVRYLGALANAEYASTLVAAAKNAVAMELGQKYKAVWLNEKIADRRAKQGGTPYMQAANGLLKLDLLTRYNDQKDTE